MLYPRPTRTLIAPLTFTVCLAAQMLGWIATAHAEATAPSPPTPEARSAVRPALREFDRFLDHHPLLEDKIRRNSPLIANPAFLKKNPELRDFLKANPKVAEGLKVYPRYFLNRGLLRQASAPVSFKELGAFKDLFQQQPKLELALTAAPELIRDPEYLKSHPALHDFLVGHPALAQVFLPPPALAAHP